MPNIYCSASLLTEIPLPMKAFFHDWDAVCMYGDYSLVDMLPVHTYQYEKFNRCTEAGGKRTVMWYIESGDESAIVL